MARLLEFELIFTFEPFLLSKLFMPIYHPLLLQSFKEDEIVYSNEIEYKITLIGEGLNFLYNIHELGNWTLNTILYLHIVSKINTQNLLFSFYLFCE